MKTNEPGKLNCYFVFALCVLAAPLTLATEPGKESEREVEQIVATFMRQVAEEQCDWEPVNKLSEIHGAGLVAYLERYFKDPDEGIRWHAYSATILIGFDANDTTARQSIVGKLLARMRDDVVNSEFLAKRLQDFTAADFTQDSNGLIREQLCEALADANVGARREIILLAGVADLKSELAQLEAFIKGQEPKLKAEHERYLEGWTRIAEREGRMRWPSRTTTRALQRQYWQGSLMWAALRARARMGVKEDIKRCIELVESHPGEDYRIRRLLRELSYVRQPEVVEYLRTHLHSDKMELYRGEDVIRQSYASRAGEALAEMVRGFPVRKNVSSLDPKTIEKCRKWMAEQKQWDIIR